jgi:hypothetical protein
LVKDTPKYSGIRTYRDPGGRFQLRYPAGWHQYDLVDQRDGVMFSPQGQDPTTWFAVWSTRLEHAVTAEDLDLLREGVEEGLSQHPGLHIEASADDLYDNLIRFERVYTFEDDGTVRKRRVWMIYVWKWLFTLMAQGETLDEYAYWRMMLNDFFGYFDIAHELWFASDRELAQDLS